MKMGGGHLFMKDPVLSDSLVTQDTYGNFIACFTEVMQHRSQIT